MGIPSSKLKGIEGQLLSSDSQDDGNILKLLEDLRETVYDYQVRPSPSGALIDLNRGNR
jgi:hypothetical protein